MTTEQREEAAEVCNMRASAFEVCGHDTALDEFSAYSDSREVLSLAAAAFFAVACDSGPDTDSIDLWLETEFLVRAGWSLDNPW